MNFGDYVILEFEMFLIDSVGGIGWSDVIGYSSEESNAWIIYK